MVAVGWGLCCMSREQKDSRRVTKRNLPDGRGPLLQGQTRREGIDGGKVQGRGGDSGGRVLGATPRVS